VNARVRVVLKNGLLLSFLTYFTGTVSFLTVLSLLFSALAPASKFSWLMLVYIALICSGFLCVGGHFSSGGSSAWC
jgi:hypothetical protein